MPAPVLQLEVGGVEEVEHGHSLLRHPAGEGRSWRAAPAGQGANELARAAYHSGTVMGAAAAGVAGCAAAAAFVGSAAGFVGASAAACGGGRWRLGSRSRNADGCRQACNIP
jgi:hypothetical protein